MKQFYLTQRRGVAEGVLGKWGACLLVAGAISGAAFADVPADTQLTLGEVDLPVYIHVTGGGAGFTQPTVEDAVAAAVPAA